MKQPFIRMRVEIQPDKEGYISYAIRHKGTCVAQGNTSNRLVIIHIISQYICQQLDLYNRESLS